MHPSKDLCTAPAYWKAAVKSCLCARRKGVEMEGRFVCNIVTRQGGVQLQAPAA